VHKKIIRLALCVLLFAQSIPARAQQAVRIPRIGILIPSSASFFSARVDAFRQRLRELGYVEGKNILIEYRKKASATIPIVFATAADPVGAGLVSSLARPGGNITGLSLMAPDLNGKRLELLKEAFPKVRRVAFLWGSGGARGNLTLTEMEAAAKALRIKLLSLEVRSLDDFESAFARAKREGAQALITTVSPLFNDQQRQVLDFAAKNRLPAMYPASEFVEAGGLMSYGPNYTDSWRRAAGYVDKILKGAKPADMSVEQPTKFELIINLKAAKQIGVTIPQRVQARADKLIK
jgi:putative ABC transport system substrate-binding protein